LSDFILTELNSAADNYIAKKVLLTI